MNKSALNHNVWVFTWLCKTKLWWKSKIVLYGYSQFHFMHKHICKYIAEDVETRFDTSNYALECNAINGPLPKGKNLKK